MASMVGGSRVRSCANAGHSCTARSAAGAGSGSGEGGGGQAYVSPWAVEQGMDAEALAAWDQVSPLVPPGTRARGCSGEVVSQEEEAGEEEEKEEEGDGAKGLGGRQGEVRCQCQGGREGAGIGSGRRGGALVAVSSSASCCSSCASSSSYSAKSSYSAAEEPQPLSPVGHCPPLPLSLLLPLPLPLPRHFGSHKAPSPSANSGSKLASATAAASQPPLAPSSSGALLPSTSNSSTSSNSSSTSSSTLLGLRHLLHSLHPCDSRRSIDHALSWKAQGHREGKVIQFHDAESGRERRVRLGELVGVGSYGRVCMCKDEVSGEVLACKIINKGFFAWWLNLGGIRDKVVHEIEFLRLLGGHPNVLHLHSVYEDRCNVYLFTEYCPDGDLQQKLVLDGKLPEKVAAEIFRQMVLGVCFCHDKGVAHRDIKPENILISSSSSSSSASRREAGALPGGARSGAVADSSGPLCGAAQGSVSDPWESRGLRHEGVERGADEGEGEGLGNGEVGGMRRELQRKGQESDWSPEAESPGSSPYEDPSWPEAPRLPLWRRLARAILSWKVGQGGGTGAQCSLWEGGKGVERHGHGLTQRACSSGGPGAHAPAAKSRLGRSPSDAMVLATEEQESSKEGAEGSPLWPGAPSEASLLEPGAAEQEKGTSAHTERQQRQHQQQQQEQAEEEEGVLWEVKLADFGSSVFLSPWEGKPGLAGSKLYMAPEKIQGGRYGHPADMWSLGVILYAFLSGKLPFLGGTDKELECQITSGRVEFEEECWCLVSDEARGLVTRLLVLDPEARPRARGVVNDPWLVKHCGEVDVDSSPPLTPPGCSTRTLEAPLNATSKTRAPQVKAPTAVLVAPNPTEQAQGTC